MPIPARGDIIVVGLGFGDEAKGATTDHLAVNRQAPVVVRYNGGAQAAHNVLVEGIHHTFSQFGSGTFAGSDTYLSHHVLVEPMAMAKEAEVLASKGISRPLSNMFIHPDATITTPFHIAANRARHEHGSCGRGVGETAWHRLVTKQFTIRPGQLVGNLTVPSSVETWPLYVRDCRIPSVLKEKLLALQRFYEPLVEIEDSIDDLMDLYQSFAASVQTRDYRWLSTQGDLIFEGAQGVLLDEWKGFHPYTTWSNTTSRNAQWILTEKLERPRGYTLGVLRSYHTRHGAGPFPSENEHITHPESHNGTGKFQGPWRQGYFDAVLARYAVQANGGVDGIALTHTDRLTNIVNAYRLPTGERVDNLPVPEPRNLQRQEALTRTLEKVAPCILYNVSTPDRVARLLQAPVVSTSNGPDRKNRELTDYIPKA